MKPSQIAYSTLDKIYTAANSNDRANRGVKPLAWFMAFAFSFAVWAIAFSFFK